MSNTHTRNGRLRDPGYTNDQVFGRFKERAEKVRAFFESEDVQNALVQLAALDALAANPTQSDAMTAEGIATARGNILAGLRRIAEEIGSDDVVDGLDLEPTKRSDLVDDWTLDLVFNEINDVAIGELKQLLRSLDVQPLRIQRTTIGETVVARVRLSSDDYANVEDLNKLLDAIEQHKPRVERIHQFGSAPGHFHVDNGRIRFEPGAISFKPGAISFKPGAISFKPGAISFKPGAISYKQQIIVPMPAECETDLLNSILLERWQAGMERAGELDNRITVAVLDTGIGEVTLKKHPLFVGTLARDEIGASPDVEPVPANGLVDVFFGHGTLVAGIVALEAPFARLNHESVRGRTGGTDSFELARDLQDIGDADIVVMSLATSASSADDVPVLKRLVGQMIAEGKIVVVADGSQGDLRAIDHKLYPADFTEQELTEELDRIRSLSDSGGAGSDVSGGEGAGGADGMLITVKACDRTGALIPTARVAIDGPASNGADAASTDENARKRVVTDYGVGVLSAFPHGQFRFGADGPMLPFCDWARVTGTSFAAPRVAGRIAHRMRDGMAARKAAAAVLKDLAAEIEQASTINASTSDA